MGKEYTDNLLIDFGEDGEKLLPVVTQDINTKEVLILSFVNKEAFDETRKSGFATYYSRSRKELWKKGLTSGDMLKVEEIRINCEQNSLVYIVEAEGGGICHTYNKNGKARNCYYRNVNLESLELENTDP